MPWITTQSGKHINTDWFDEDEKTKERQIAENEKQAHEKNSEIEGREGSSARNTTQKEIKFLNEVAPYGGGTNRSEVESQIKENIETAKSQGYEVISRSYQTKGRSGQLYDWTESKIEHPTKPGSSGELKLSNSSNLGKHVEDVKSLYKDVIIVPASPILPYTTKGRQGFKTTYKAEYYVMARDRKRS